MTLKLIVAPTEDAVSLEELKSHLDNKADTDNDKLAQELSAAETDIRNQLGRALITSTWDMSLERWPCRGYIDLPCNVQSIASVKYTDSEGAEHTLDPATYKLARAYDTATSGNSDAGPARLYLSYARTWPSATLDTGEPIVIRLVMGWKDASCVPTPIKQAVLMMAAHLFRNPNAVVAERGVVPAEMALGVSRLISVYEDRRW